MGNTLVILGRVVAGAAMGFLFCSLVWFLFWFGVAWICNGQAPVLSNIPVGMFLTDPTWVLIIFSIPIIGAFHGLIRGADRRFPLHNVPWVALRDCVATFAVLGQVGVIVGMIYYALLALLLVPPGICGAALGVWVCHLVGVKDAAQGGMPGFVAGAIVGLLGMNLLVLRLSAKSQDGDLRKTPFSGGSAVEQGAAADGGRDPGS